MPWWGNMLVGVGVIAVLAVVTVATAGAAGVGVGAAFAAGFTGSAIGTGSAGVAATIATSAFAGAVIGGSTSMIAAGVMTAASGGSFEEVLNSSSNSFMFGAALGAFSGGLNSIGFSANETINIGIHMGINSIASVGTYLGQTAYTYGNLNNVSFGGLAITAIGGASSGYLPSSIAESGYYNFIANQGVFFVDFIASARRKKW